MGDAGVRTIGWASSYNQCLGGETLGQPYAVAQEDPGRMAHGVHWVRGAADGRRCEVTNT